MAKLNHSQSSFVVLLLLTMTSNVALGISENACSDPAYISEYLSRRNCMIESHGESCNELTMNPAGVFGLVSGLGYLLYKNQKPDIVEGMKKIAEMNEKMPVLLEEVRKIKNDVYKENESRKKNFFKELKKKYANNRAALNALQILENRTGPNMYSTSISELPIGNEIGKKLTDFYNKYYDKEILSRMNKSNNSTWKILPKNMKLNIVDTPYNRNLFGERDLLQQMLGKDAAEPSKIAEKVRVETRNEITKKYRISNEVYDRIRTKENYGSNDQRLNTEASKIFQDKYSKKILASSPEVQFFDKLNRSLTPQDFNPVSEAQKFNFKAITRSTFKTAMKGGLVGVLGGVATSITMNERSKYELKKCARKLGLTQEELDFLNNSSSFLASSKTKSDQFMPDCKMLYLENPEDTLNLALQKFDYIPDGICGMITRENELLKSTVEKSLKNLNASCIDRKVTSDHVDIDFTNANLPVAEIKISRSGENFVYQTPIFNNNSVPNFSSVKVFRVSEKGEKVLDSRYTNDFMEFMKRMMPANQTIDLGKVPEEGLNSPKEQLLFAQERQRKLNAYINQTYWIFSQGCKGYNNIECEVLEKTFSVAPVMHNMRSICKKSFLDIEAPSNQGPLKTMDR